MQGTKTRKRPGNIKQLLGLKAGQQGVLASPTQTFGSPLLLAYWPQSLNYSSVPHTQSSKSNWTHRWFLINVG